MTEEEPQRPLPNINDADFAPYWQGTSEGRLQVQRCASCGYYRWPPRPICPHCMSEDVEWPTTPLTGRLHTWTTIWHTAIPYFAQRTPFTVGLIELECEPGVVRMYGNLRDVETADLTVGDEFEAVFVETHEPGVTLVEWRPAGKAEE